jgi:hypothetical protein
MTKTAAVFSSRLAPTLKRYVDLKRALGRRFDEATRTLQLLDRFLQDQTIRYPDLNAAAFQAWCQTQEHLASGVRRGRMREVYNFCLYRLRTEPQCFVPDPVLFPKPHQRLQPYIFSEQKLKFQELIEEIITVKRRLRAMSFYQFLLSMVLAIHVFSFGELDFWLSGVKGMPFERSRYPADAFARNGVRDKVGS